MSTLNSANSSCSSILDIPDKMLIKIILYLNARERIPLGDSCKRFNSLIFKDEALLSDLDFSRDGRLTSAQHIWRYFNNKNTCKHILKVNIRNTNCIKPGYPLNDSIGKATNLVDINIHGTKFKDVWQLGCFLQHLLHVQRLSIDWDESDEKNIPLCHRALRISFGRLIYLSVKMKAKSCFKVFIPSLLLCQKLQELRMVAENCGRIEPGEIWIKEPRQLKNLKIVEYFGNDVATVKERFVPMLPDPEKWVDFKVYTLSDKMGFYLENIEVCEELLGREWMENNPIAGPPNQLNFGRALYPELLLNEVIRISHEQVPQKFCCLSTFMDGGRCLLKTNEAKRLLKNARSQVSYLYINHLVELACDLHLIASAFPNLVELVLTNVIRDLSSISDDTHIVRRLRKIGSVVHEKTDDSLNMDSSFKMLIENTPHLRHLTLGERDGSYVDWDQDELYLIANWKNLQTLRLWKIEITTGDFLIEIGKRCKNLQKLELIQLNSGYDYEKELLQMLKYCESLRDFSIDERRICIPKVFASLVNKVELSRVCAIGFNGEHSTAEWILSIENLLRKCSRLTTFVYEIQTKDRNVPHDFPSTLARLKEEINRPNFQYYITWILGVQSRSILGGILEDVSEPNPFP